MAGRYRRHRKDRDEIGNSPTDGHERGHRHDDHANDENNREGNGELELKRGYVSRADWADKLALYDAIM